MIAYYYVDAPAGVHDDSVTAGGSTVPDLGNLTSLHVLDLSNNNLEGTLPKSFVNHTSLQFLNFSFNNLAGTLPVGSNSSLLDIADFSHNKLDLSTVLA